MPGITYQVGLYLGDRFCRGASPPGPPGRDDGPEQRRRLVVHERDGRRDGPLHRANRRRRVRVRGRAAARWRSIEEEIAVRGQARARAAGGPRDRTTGRSSTRRCGPTTPSRSRCASSALDFPGITEANFGVLDFASGPELVEALAEHAHPVSNLVWADRHGSIGYKTVGRIPLRHGGCPDLPKPGWTGEYEWDGWIPYEELPRARSIPRRGFVVTANNRIAPEDYPHHITSDYLDGYRAHRIEELLAGARTSTTWTSFESMQTDMLSIPGLETAHRLARLRPRDQRELTAIERLRSWDGRHEPGLDRGDDLPGVHAAARRARSPRAAIGDRDLSERWLDRADNGFIAHVTSPWRWQSHLLDALGGGRRGADRRARGTSSPSMRCAARSTTSRTGFGPDPRPWRWGRVHPLVFPHALGAANPCSRRIFNRRLEVGGAQETVAQVGWDPNDPLHGDLGAVLADGRRPDRPRALALAGVHRPVGPPGEPALRRPPAGLAGGPHPADGGRGPLGNLL